MDKILTIKEKILTYIAIKGISKSDFFTNIGVAPSNFKGKNLTSQLGGDAIVKVLTSYPDINPNWLLLGEGSMCRDEQEEEDIAVCAKEQPVVDLYEGKAKRGLPYYDKDMVEFCGTDTEAPACLSLDDYFCQHADLYCTCCEHSMSPCIRYGDILALKEVRIEDILYGEVYAILMERERLIRQIKSSHDDLSLTFIPYNSDFEPQIFKKSSIIKVYRVVGSVHRFT